MISPTYASEERDAVKAAKFFQKEIQASPEWGFISLHVTMSRYKERIRLEFGTLEWPNGLLTVKGMYVALDAYHLGVENGKHVFALEYSGVFQKKNSGTPHPHCYPTSREDAPMCTPKRGKSFSVAAAEFLLAGDIASLVSGASDVVMSINWYDTYRHGEIDLAALKRALRDPNDPDCPRCGSDSRMKSCVACGERGCTGCGSMYSCYECNEAICDSCSLEIMGGYVACSESCVDEVNERMVSCSSCSRRLDPRRHTVEQCRGCGTRYCINCSHNLTYCNVHPDSSNGLCKTCLPGAMTPAFAIDRPKLGLAYSAERSPRIRITSHNCSGACDLTYRQRYCIFCGYWCDSPDRYVHFDEPFGTGVVCSGCTHYFTESSFSYYVRGKDEVDIMTLTSIYNLILARDVRFPPIVATEGQYEIRISEHANRPDDEPVSWIRFSFGGAVESDPDPDHYSYDTDEDGLD